MTQNLHTHSSFDDGQNTLEEMIHRATHSILIGRVQAIRTTPGQGALIYWNGSYRGLPA